MKIPRAQHLPAETIAGQLLCLRVNTLPFNYHREEIGRINALINDGLISAICFEAIDASLVHFYSHYWIRFSPLPLFMGAPFPTAGQPHIPQMTSFKLLKSNILSDKELAAELLAIVGKESRATGLNLLIGNGFPEGMAETVNDPFIQKRLHKYGITCATEDCGGNNKTASEGAVYLSAWHGEGKLDLPESLPPILVSAELSQINEMHQQLQQMIAGDSNLQAAALTIVDKSLRLRKKLYSASPAQAHPGRIHKWLSHPKHLTFAEKLTQRKTD